MRGMNSEGLSRFRALSAFKSSLSLPQSERWCLEWPGKGRGVKARVTEVSKDGTELNAKVTVEEWLQVWLES